MCHRKLLRSKKEFIKEGNNIILSRGDVIYFKLARRPGYGQDLGLIHDFEGNGSQLLC